MPLPSTSSPKRATLVDDGRIGVRAGDDLEQLHVAHGVEEVRHQEALLHRRRAPFHHLRDRQARGVRGDDGVLGEQRLEPGEERALDREILFDDLDDEIALAGLVEIVLEVADGDEVGVARREERGRLGLERLVLAAAARTRCAPPLPSGGTMSSRSTSMPAPARCAAMPEPMTPAPSTLTLRKSLIADLLVGLSRVSMLIV